MVKAILGCHWPDVCIVDFKSLEHWGLPCELWQMPFYLKRSSQFHEALAGLSTPSLPCSIWIQKA